MNALPMPGFPYFLAELAKRGYREGRNLAVDSRHIPEEPGPAAVAAAALVREHDDLIVVGGPEYLRAAQHATRTIPIVFTAINYDSLARADEVIE